MKSKISVGQRIQVEIWREAANHWDWGGPETYIGTVVALPIPTYKNNWNYNPTEFDIRTDEGKIVHIENARDIKVMPPSSNG